MTDKERILSAIIQRFYPGYILGFKYDGECKFSYLSNSDNVKIGDLVLCTSCRVNEYLIGFVNEIYDSSHMLIREIGTDNTCDVSNESFCKIDTSYLGYEILEGVKYETYKKVLKAFEEYTSYSTRFRNIEFVDDECIVTSRLMFDNDEIGRISFKYSSKTTVKAIGKLLKSR